MLHTPIICDARHSLSVITIIIKEELQSSKNCVFYPIVIIIKYN
jgi:hypothetical protein